MKKKILIISLMTLIFTATACGSKDKVKKENNETPTPETQTVADKSIEEQVQNKTEQVQDEISFSDIKISEFGASNIVSGKATNNKSEVRNIKLNLKMYNGNSDKLLGRVSTELRDFKPGETREFEISIMGDYSIVDQFKVEVEDI